MTTPRRRVIRPAASPTPRARRLPQLRTRLERERQLLGRWLLKLKRAFHSFEKYQLKVSRLEREIRVLEEA